jgi:ABC-type uncharacterized transport system involved in gliding motility auxiliary subunit
MRIRHIITVVLIGLIAIFVIHIAHLATAGWRADVTEDQLYSLTEGTREILTRMQDEGVRPLDITMYFSQSTGKSLPRFIKQFVVYEDYMRSLLREYERAAGGTIRVNFIDPVTDSDEAQLALDAGLDGKPINQHGDLFFFGLVIETQTGSREIIEFLWPNEQENVEYEISKRVYSLLWPSKQRIGIISSLDVIAESNPYMAQLMAAQGRRPPESWIITRLLEERYEVTRIDLNTDHISHNDHDLLIVVHPRDFDTKTLWAIDEWVATGGNAVVLLDPYSIDDRPPTNPQQPWAAMQYKPASNLERLTSAWGVVRQENEVAADPSLGLRRMVSRRGGTQNIIVDLQFDQERRGDAVNPDHTVTRGLGTLRFFMAGNLVKEEDAETEFTPLVTTTSTGNTLRMVPGFGGGDELTFNDVNTPERLRDVFTEGNEPVVLVGALTGQLGPAFTDGATFPSQPPERPAGLPPGVEMPPPENAEMITKEPLSPDVLAPATVVLFSDVDFISNQVAFQQSLFGPAAANDNHKLFLNAVDFLLGAQELMNVRTKSSIQRPFVLFDEIEAQADERTQARERELRDEIAQFQEQVQEKQRELSQRNAALLQKTLQDEVNQLNDRIAEANSELREIRKAKRAALEAEEARVRFSMMWLMPSLVLILGITLFVQRKRRENAARKG